jgi:hypothetical protein
MTDELSAIIDRLQKAIEVCRKAEQITEYDAYPYAAGYSRAIMMDTIEDLKILIYTQSQ